ncbi:Aste57867_19064 [Aphanomyces stellatus]|uniref:Aste57867_19064 protein n=1 Tax=Aphanomyces stellatus TaxID=120398 RepID=A0A485LBW8_9STRA|nr:hypothetical protein As57867_019000 [Aphanomyces stellatus]VFT95789.1 Aste57867_19064 [Aphanomyces stellatus]
MLTQVLVPVLVALCSTLMYFAAITPSGDAWSTTWIETAEDKNDNVTWLNEGTKDTYRLQEFGESKSYCFLPNASLPFRVDSLNDLRHPYIVQWLSQYKEVHGWIEEASPYLSHLQQYVGQIQPWMWGWSDLRVLIDSEYKSKLSFSYKTPASSFCFFLEHMKESTYPYVRDYVPDVLLYVFSNGGEFMRSYCEGCSNGCMLPCEDGFGPNFCIATLSPYQYPCVTVTGPATGMLSSQAHISFTTQFQSGKPTPSTQILRCGIAEYLESVVVSLKYGLNLMSGYFLYFFSFHLARSRLFHYLLGAAIGVVCSVALLLYQLYKQSQSTLRLLPGSSFIQSASLLTTVAFPVTGLMLLPTLYSILQWALGLLFQFWMIEEVVGIPHLGKLYFLFFGLVGMVLVWWFQWWAAPVAGTPSDEQEEYDEDGILEDIRRMEAEDALLPDNQLRLARSLQVFAIMLLFQSTSSTLLSWVFVLVALLWSFLEALYAHMYYWYWSETPGLHSTLITTDEFAAQGKTETEKALAELRKYLKENPEVAEDVREENEVRLRRFMNGRDHMETSNRGQKPAPPASSSWCCIQ